MALNANMGLHEYIVVRVAADGKNYTAWVVNGPLPEEPMQALGNRTTSASTMGSNIQNALPTLAS